MNAQTAAESVTPLRTLRSLVRRCSVAALLVASACASADMTSDDVASTTVPVENSDGTPKISPARDPSNVSHPADAASASSVGVLTSGCGPAASAGSGVALGEPGQVVTVAHTVAGATSITVVTGDGAELDARVVAFDPDSDLAVLEVSDLTAPPLDVGSVQLGDATLVSWSTDSGIEARPIEVAKRLAITIDDIYGAHSAQRSGFEIAGDIVVGDSGGPVVSPNGDVIGIVYARSRTRPSTAFATDAEEITELLDAVANEPVDNGTCV